VHTVAVKIAIIHELLTMRGGAERVLRSIAEMFPEAPIYTLLYDEKKLGDWFPKERVRTSTLQRYARFSTNHHLYLPWFPRAVQAWDFREFDVVLSTSSAFVHGILTNGAPRHLCYVHSPARYLWDRTHDVLAQAGKGLLGPLRRAYLERVFHRLRIWDSEAADRPDALLTASLEVQRRVELYWRRPSTVLYPPIDDRWLTASPVQSTREQPNYFLIVSTLARYKRIDLAIAACTSLGIHLKIVGEGPDRTRLERMAGPTVAFYGRRNHDELVDLYGGAQATIVPGEEDFCLVALESMACGTPVIAYGKGGVTETVIEGKTGVFFAEPTPESLSAALSSFNTQSFNADLCKARAAEFSQKRFTEGLRSALAAL
jgi:glycosyltransferase involved in cell wall biosynthesis